MRKKCVQMGVWVFFLIFLPISRSSSPNDGKNCPVDSMRVVCGKEEWNRSPFCDQKLSSQCVEEEKASEGSALSFSCHDVLGKIIEDEHVCKERKTADSCGEISPSHITPPEEPLVYLRLYHYHDPDQSWGHEARVNVTLPAPTWKELNLQYSTFVDNGYQHKCRSFSLERHINSTLMYECRFRKQFGDKNRNVRFTVKSGSGEGANYVFKTPPGTMIHPEETCPSDWHVFFYVHQDAIQRYDPLPVTVQSSPYGQVKYRVMLAKCSVPGDKECSEYDEVDHVLVIKNTTDDLWTVYLLAITTGGNYTVRVQMVADWCPEPNGCYISVSPRFEVPSSSAWIFLLLSICLILMFIVSMLLKLWQRMKLNKEFFERMKSTQPTVLLAYHPESPAALNFVRKLAEFLKNTCCVTSLLVDEEVGIENPSNWTRDKMNDANNRVLFVVPKDSKAQSSTPIRNQWDVALGECNSDQFITNQNNIKRLAKLIHPNSGSVPREIRNVRCFDLSDNPTALANWLHDGSFLDQIFLWLPHIRSSAKKCINPTWTQVKLAARNIGSPVTDGKLLARPSPPSPGIQIAVDVVQEDEKSSDDEYNGESRHFDPDIPDIRDIIEASISSPEASGDEHDGLFY